MEFKIREAVMDDIPQIQEVAKTSWNATYDGIIPLNIQEGFLSSAYSDEMMKYRMENSLMIVAEVKDQIVGFANFSPLKEDGEAELGAIYLYPMYQGNGIGSSLLNAGVESLREVRKIYINVEKENKIGTTFYKAKGFKIVSEFDDNFDGHILKTVRMVLRV